MTDVKYQMVWCNRASGKQSMAELHVAGCADLAKQAQRRGGSIEDVDRAIDPNDWESVARWAGDAAFYQGSFDNGEWPDFSVAPCARKAGRMAAKATITTATAEKETTMATTTKTCPGVKDGETVVRPAHEAPATEAVFGKNAARKDGLGRVCKDDWAAYTKILKARKGGDVPAKAKAVEPTGPKYHDDLAERIAAEDVTGWVLETIGGTIYALPTDVATVATDEGQAALVAIDEAKKADRRRKDRERKRAAYVPKGKAVDPA